MLYVISNISKLNLRTTKYNVNDCFGFDEIRSNSGSTFSLHIETQMASCTMTGT